jgi:hypothetical protein
MGLLASRLCTTDSPAIQLAVSSDVRWLVSVAVGVHPVPSRTRSLSPPAPMVLGGEPPGRLGRCQPSDVLSLLYSTLPPGKLIFSPLCFGKHPIQQYFHSYLEIFKMRGLVVSFDLFLIMLARLTPFGLYANLCIVCSDWNK